MRNRHYYAGLGRALCLLGQRSAEARSAAAVRSPMKADDFKGRPHTACTVNCRSPAFCGLAGRHTDRLVYDTPLACVVVSPPPWSSGLSFTLPETGAYRTSGVGSK